jgi:hypothetical protein
LFFCLFFSKKKWLAKNNYKYSSEKSDNKLAHKPFLFSQSINHNHKTASSKSSTSLHNNNNNTPFNNNAVVVASSSSSTSNSCANHLLLIDENQNLNNFLLNNNHNNNEIDRNFKLMFDQTTHAINQNEKYNEAAAASSSLFCSPSSPLELIDKLSQQRQKHDDNDDQEETSLSASSTTNTNEITVIQAAAADSKHSSSSRTNLSDEVLSPISSLIAYSSPLSSSNQHLTMLSSGQRQKDNFSSQKANNTINRNIFDNQNIINHSSNSKTKLDAQNKFNSQTENKVIDCDKSNRILNTVNESSEAARELLNKKIMVRGRKTAAKKPKKRSTR